MPIKPEEALEVIGLSPDRYDSVEAFKDAIEAKYVSRDSAHTDPTVTSKVMGKFNAVITRKVNKLAKELEYDLPKDAEPLDLLDAIAEPVLGLKTQLSGWKEKAEKNIADDVLREWETKLKKAEKERDLFRGQAQEFGKKYEDLNAEIVTTKRNTIVGGAWSSALNGIPFHSGVDDLRKEGFVAKVKSKYKVDVDDDGKVTLLNDKGELVKHPKRAGEMLTLDEALKMEAAAFKLVADNPHAGRPAPQYQQPGQQRAQQQQPVAQPGGGRVRRAAKGWGL
jgi:hypothetical protein